MCRSLKKEAQLHRHGLFWGTGNVSMTTQRHIPHTMKGVSPQPQLAGKNGNNSCQSTGAKVNNHVLPRSRALQCLFLQAVVSGPKHNTPFKHRTAGAAVSVRGDKAENAENQRPRSRADVAAARGTPDDTTTHNRPRRAKPRQRPRQRPNAVNAAA